MDPEFQPSHISLPEPAHLPEVSPPPTPSFDEVMDLIQQVYTDEIQSWKDKLAGLQDEEGMC